MNAQAIANINKFKTSKAELSDSIDILNKKITACTAEKPNHKAMIFILDEMNELYKTKFIPFHTAAGAIFGENAEAQKEFTQMQTLLKNQCDSIKKLWKEHKQERSILQTSKSIWQDNETKKAFQYNSSKIEKAVLLSKPLKSYSPSNYHFMSGDGFLTGFLWGAILC